MTVSPSGSNPLPPGAGTDPIADPNPVADQISVNALNSTIEQAGSTRNSGNIGSIRLIAPNITIAGWVPAVLSAIDAQSDQTKLNILGDLLVSIGFSEEILAFFNRYDMSSLLTVGYQGFIDATEQNIEIIGLNQAVLEQRAANQEFNETIAEPQNLLVQQYQDCLASPPPGGCGADPGPPIDLLDENVGTLLPLIPPPNTDPFTEGEVTDTEGNVSSPLIRMAEIYASKLTGLTLVETRLLFQSFDEETDELEDTTEGAGELRTPPRIFFDAAPTDSGVPAGTSAGLIGLKGGLTQALTGLIDLVLFSSGIFLRNAGLQNTAFDGIEVRTDTQVADGIRVLRTRRDAAGETENALAGQDALTAPVPPLPDDQGEAVVGQVPPDFVLPLPEFLEELLPVLPVVPEPSPAPNPRPREEDPRDVRITTPPEVRARQIETERVDVTRSFIADQAASDIAAEARREFNEVEQLIAELFADDDSARAILSDDISRALAGATALSGLQALARTEELFQEQIPITEDLGRGLVAFSVAQNLLAQLVLGNGLQSIIEARIRQSQELRELDRSLQVQAFEALRLSESVVILQISKALVDSIGSRERQFIDGIEEFEGEVQNLEIKIIEEAEAANVDRIVESFSHVNEVNVSMVSYLDKIIDPGWALVKAHSAFNELPEGHHSDIPV